MGLFIPSKVNQGIFPDVLAGNLQCLRKKQLLYLKWGQKCASELHAEWTIWASKYIYTSNATDMRFGKPGSEKHKVKPKQAVVSQALESLSNARTSSELPFISRLQHIIEPVWEAPELGISCCHAVRNKLWKHEWFCALELPTSHDPEP